jgi:hypothetical protein
MTTSTREVVFRVRVVCACVRVCERCCVRDIICRVGSRALALKILLMFLLLCCCVTLDVSRVAPRRFCPGWCPEFVSRSVPPLARWYHYWCPDSFLQPPYHPKGGRGVCVHCARAAKLQWAMATGC